jgi:fumarate reductase flavoprotein subunit
MPITSETTLSKVQSLKLPTKVDVVVVGAGLAGYCAALEAAVCGAQVVLLEKQLHSGGSTVISGGFMAFAGTRLQSAMGLQDYDELLLRDLRVVGGPEADEALLEVYVRQQRGLYDWLTAFGVRFESLEHSAGQSVARSHQTDPQALIDTLAGQLRLHASVQVVMGVEMVSLIRCVSGGPVTGLTFRASGTLHQLDCEGGIVLASGGFSRSEALLSLFAPAQAGAVRIGGEGNTGDGLRQAWKLGAGLRDMGQIRGTFGTHPDCGPERHEILLAFYLGAIIVNQQGRRFIDESRSYKQLGDAALQQSQCLAFQLFDRQVMEKSATGVPLFDLQQALDRGLLRQAETLDELACQCGLDEVALRATVAAYNAGVDSGHDEFGRDGLCHHVGLRTRIDQAPFFAYLSTTVVLATYCGLDIDTETRVRDVDGDVINGLYAAGEVAGGFHGRSYMTGTSLGKAAIFGRIAGRQAAWRALGGP